ncbi:MAG: hypothetical protein XE11_0396 [Methanomicrobiales archaeon 53_19]|jgi:hypothetical protein|nr:MAG: hypothetical protein XD88_0429 [Methanocalculus sp. 52_23]KUL04616.1 MAG: hypothetical protein XE11_0396 [Methanomicrobiales archaeon 53_19]
MRLSYNGLNQFGEQIPSSHYRIHHPPHHHLPHSTAGEYSNK